MSAILKRTAAAALLLSSGLVEAQETATVTTTDGSSASECATVLTPSYSPPVVAKGWKAQLIATGLSNPRGIKFDTNGGLLVVEGGVGLTHLTFNDNGGTCLSLKGNHTVLADKEVSLHARP